MRVNESDAFGGSLSDSWLDNMYYEDEFNGGVDDQCPVAFSVGSNGTDAHNRLHNERYDEEQEHPHRL